VIVDSSEREAHHQVCVRADNELTSRGPPTDASAAAPTFSFRCECGDPQCRDTVNTTRAEYEDVRALGSRFLIVDRHENPEICRVVSVRARFAIVETIGRDARRIVLRGNPRHTWP